MRPAAAQQPGLEPIDPNPLVCSSTLRPDRLRESPAVASPPIAPALGYVAGPRQTLPIRREKARQEIRECHSPNSAYRLHKVSLKCRLSTEDSGTRALAGRLRPHESQRCRPAKLVNDGWTEPGLDALQARGLLAGQSKTGARRSSSGTRSGPARMDREWSRASC